MPKSVCKALQCRAPVPDEPETSQLLSRDGSEMISSYVPWGMEDRVRGQEEGQTK